MPATLVTFSLYNLSAKIYNIPKICQTGQYDKEVVNNGSLFIFVLHLNKKT